MDREFIRQHVHYLVCKMLTWDKIEITLADGRTQQLHRPEGEPIVGFIPVYADMIDAKTSAGSHDIIALMIKDGAFYRHEEGDANANNEDG